MRPRDESERFSKINVQFGLKWKYNLFTQTWTLLTIDTPHLDQIWRHRIRISHKCPYKQNRCSIVVVCRLSVTCWQQVVAYERSEESIWQYDLENSSIQVYSSDEVYIAHAADFLHYFLIRSNLMIWDICELDYTYSRIH